MPKTIRNHGEYDFTNIIEMYFKEFGKKSLEELIEQIVENYELSLVPVSDNE